MAKRMGQMESYKVKQFIFILVLLLAFVVVYLSITNQETVVPLVIVLAAIAILLFLVRQYDFLLTLKEYERVLIYRFGHVNRVGGPGWAFMIPLIESFKIVDLRTNTIDIPEQEVITKDKIVTKVDAIVYLYVKPDAGSVTRSVIEIDDYKKAAELFVLSSIRDVAGTMTSTELISNTAELNKKVKEKLAQIAESWGVTIESVEISSIKLPETVSSAMHEQKAAEQKKLARMESALANQAEIDAVRTAAGQLSDKALAYYYIRALEKLGEGPATKFIFPMELSRLAEQLAGRVSSGVSTNDSSIEKLFKKYAPAIKEFVETEKKGKNEKKK
jgi:regulator of protease activity HflC (stomatin/prohibitin superfamily)